MNHIGNRIRELRREAGLTQEKLAGYLNVSYQTISKWETGVNTPDLAYLVPLSILLHTTTDELLGNTSFPKEADERKKKLEAAWKEAWEDKQEGERLIAAARALTEAYPENPVYWWRLAYGERMRAHEMNEPEQEEERTAFFEQALTHFQMVIEDAERFGLAQLHQLRGRVGRGQWQSYCFLINEGQSELAKQRGKIMEASADGFYIAEEDLKLRGPGEIFGTRQHGLPDMKLADMVRHMDVLNAARDEAKALLEEDPHLLKPENASLKRRVEKLFGEDLTLNL